MLIDDRSDVAAEAESGGILTYHVAKPGTRARDSYWVSAPGFYQSFEQSGQPNLGAAVEQLCADDTTFQSRVGGGLSSVLDNKLARVNAAKSW